MDRHLSIFEKFIDGFCSLPIPLRVAWLKSGWPADQVKMRSTFQLFHVFIR